MTKCPFCQILSQQQHFTCIKKQQTQMALDSKRSCEFLYYGEFKKMTTYIYMGLSLATHCIFDIEQTDQR